MTELQVQNKEVKLPYDIELSYEVTIYLPNGDRSGICSASSYEDARDIYLDFAEVGNPVELTCNVEVYKSEEYSETEYISIAKNFKELG